MDTAVVWFEWGKDLLKEGPVAKLIESSGEKDRAVVLEQRAALMMATNLATAGQVVPTLEKLRSKFPEAPELTLLPQLPGRPTSGRMDRDDVREG